MIIYLSFDHFKVIYNYDKFYSDHKIDFIPLNRGYITTQTFLKFKDSLKFNSFIFGNSRSQAFTCEEWIKYIDSSSIPFHFDASGESLYGIAQKMKFIDKIGLSIKNALIIIDESSAKIDKNRDNGHLYISPYEISGESSIRFYWTFFKAQLNPKWLIIYFDHLIFKKNRKYMRNPLPLYPHQVNHINCDMIYGWDMEIKTDSVNYYKKLIEKGVFDKKYNFSRTLEISDKNIQNLITISDLLKKHQTDYKIIIPPLFNKQKFPDEQKQIYRKLFIENKIYDFSGINDISSEIGNYYEDSHFKPFVANGLLKKIYLK